MSRHPLQNLCSAPEELWWLFSVYNQRVDYHSNQQDHRTHVNEVCKIGVSHLDAQGVLTGKLLIDFMGQLLFWYQKDAGQSEANDHAIKKVITEHNDLAPSAGCFNTTFGFSREGNSKNSRQFFNFVTVKRIYEVASRRIHTNQEEIGLTLGELCARAKKYFGFEFGDFDSAEKSMLVAEIVTMKIRKISQYLHRFKQLSMSVKVGHQAITKLYDALLSIIYGPKTTKESQLNAIFLLVFVIGSNPPLYNGKGGAFITDFMLQYLLHSTGNKPIQKNFLGLTEVELLLRYSEDDEELWNSPRMLYQNAMSGETNLLFHPVDAGAVGLSNFLTQLAFQDLYSSEYSNDCLSDLTDEPEEQLDMYFFLLRINTERVLDNNQKSSGAYTTTLKEIRARLDHCAMLQFARALITENLGSVIIEFLNQKEITSVPCAKTKVDFWSGASASNVRDKETVGTYQRNEPIPRKF